MARLLAFARLETDAGVVSATLDQLLHFRGGRGTLPVPNAVRWVGWCDSRRKKSSSTGAASVLSGGRAVTNSRTYQLHVRGPSRKTARVRRPGEQLA